MSRSTAWVHPRPRIRRALPAALFAIAFVGSLAASAPHSVHHLGQELERQPVACPAALAWGAASGADCPATAEVLQAPAETDRLSAEPSDLLPTIPIPARPGRAPPALL